MTRKEEIKQESKKRHLEKYNQEGFCPDFEKCAEWADKHPSMEQKQLFVDKAVEWLKNNVDNYKEFWKDWIDVETLVSHFKQEMLEE